MTCGGCNPFPNVIFAPFLIVQLLMDFAGGGISSSWNMMGPPAGRNPLRFTSSLPPSPSTEAGA